AQTARKRRAIAGGKAGRISSDAAMSINDMAPASRPSFAASPRSRRSTDSNSSTPPAPAPTTPMVTGRVADNTRARRRPNPPRNPRRGLRGAGALAARGPPPDVRGRADIDRQQIIGHWGTAAADHAAVREIEADGLVMV